MEDRFQHSVDGQEINGDDINSISVTAALADDHTLAELLRLQVPTVSGVPGARGILPASSGVGGASRSAIVVPSGSADAKVTVNGFRAVIGSRDITSGRSATYDHRSAPVIGTPGTSLSMQFPASVSNNRWDLLYVKVDIDVDDAAVNRFVKTTSGAVTSQPVFNKKKTTATLGIVPGTEATTPVRPAITADSGNSFYIPLAYVLLPAGHTLTTAIPAANIQECAPVLSLSAASGANTVRPASGVSSASGISLAVEGWTPATGRPSSFLPSTMTGGVTLFFPLSLGSTRRTISLGTTGNILDDSTDWRRRLFRVHAVANSAAFSWMPSSGGAFPSWGHTPVTTNFAQSFVQDISGTLAGLATMSNSTHSSMAAGSLLQVYVDTADGKIKADLGSTNPGCNVFLWIEATGQFNDAF